MPGQSVARSVHCHPSLRSEVVEGTNHLDSGAGDLLFLTHRKLKNSRSPASARRTRGMTVAVQDELRE